MSWFRQVRGLVSALVHRPFLPKPEMVELEEDQTQGVEERRPTNSSLNARQVDLPALERVADLIAQQQREAG
jgi:hypothetical protein